MMFCTLYHDRGLKCQYFNHLCSRKSYHLHGKEVGGKWSSYGDCCRFFVSPVGMLAEPIILTPATCILAADENRACRALFRKNLKAKNGVW